MAVKLSIILLLAFVFSSKAQEHISVSEAINGKTFAHIESPIFKFDVDTVVFKAYMSKNLNLDGRPLKFDRIEIREKMALGNPKTTFYFVMLTDVKQSITVSRWIRKKGNAFSFSKDESFHEVYVICENAKECDVNLYCENARSSLICGTEIACVKPGEIPRCPTAKSVIMDE